MRYLVMIWSNPTSRSLWDGFSAAEQAAGLQEYRVLLEELTASGELVVGEALADPTEGRRLPGTWVAADGPYAETKEHLAGFFLLDCDSMDRAAEIGARIPEAKLGLVEVRPVLQHAGLEM